MSDGWLPSGAANEGQPQDAASWMGVGPLHSIDEVAEGNEVMEKRSGRKGSRRNRRRAGHCAGNPCCRTSGV